MQSFCDISFTNDLQLYGDNDYLSNVKIEPCTSTNYQLPFANDMLNTEINLNSHVTNDEVMPFKYEDEELHETKPLDELKKSVRIGYRKEYRKSDSPKDRQRAEKRRESNRKAAEKCRVKKRQLQSVKDKQARECMNKYGKLKHDYDTLKLENDSLQAENISLKEKLNNSTPSNFELDYLIYRGEENLNFNSQHKLCYLQD